MKSQEFTKEPGKRGPKPGNGGRPRKNSLVVPLQKARPWDEFGVSESTWRRRLKDKGKAR